MNTAKLRAVGGSITISLPRPLLRQMGLEAGHEVAITSDGNSLVLAPVRKRHTLAGLLKGMKPGDMPAAAGWDGTPTAGREVW